MGRYDTDAMNMKTQQPESHCCKTPPKATGPTVALETRRNRVPKKPPPSKTQPGAEADEKQALGQALLTLQGRPDNAHLPDKLLTAIAEAKKDHQLRGQTPPDAVHRC
jgi:hypothetical protein